MREGQWYLAARTHHPLPRCRLHCVRSLRIRGWEDCMKEFREKVAVVTGAASGIGRALAQRFAREGMKVVLADVEPAALEQSAREVEALGAPALAVRTDVSKGDEVERLAQTALDEFGAVHVVCNNAGVV